MSILMKALRSFNGEQGEGKQQPDGAWFIDTGSEFSCSNEHRVGELERRELAVPVKPVVKAEPAYQNKMEDSPKNKAASAGPLDSRGGETGAESVPSLLGQVPPQRQPGSQRSKGKRGS